MGVTVKRSNNIPRLTKVLKKLGKTSIKVGVFGEDNYKYGDDADVVTIARVHEFGVTITPKSAKWLTIPLIPEAKGKRAGEFGDLTFYEVEPHKLAFLGREKSNGDMENVFMLVKSVEIPERSFLRTGFDENIDKIADKMESLLNEVFDFGINPDLFADAIGQEFAGLIQKHMKKLTNPPNSGITSNVKGSSNPLHDTGRLIGAIRHEVD